MVAVATGRPIKLTPETQDRICQSLREGLPFTLACDLAGVHRVTMIRWRNIGEKTKREPFATFATAFRQAEAEGVQARIRQIANAGNTDWRAAAWWLEHARPEEFALHRNEAATMLQQVFVSLTLAPERKAAVLESLSPAVRALLGPVLEQGE